MANYNFLEKSPIFNALPETSTSRISKLSHTSLTINHLAKPSNRHQIPHLCHTHSRDFPSRTYLLQPGKETPRTIKKVRSRPKRRLVNCAAKVKGLEGSVPDPCAISPRSASRCTQAWPCFPRPMYRHIGSAITRRNGEQRSAGKVQTRRELTNGAHR